MIVLQDKMLPIFVPMDRAGSLLHGWNENRARTEARIAPCAEITEALAAQRIVNDRNNSARARAVLDRHDRNLIGMNRARPRTRIVRCGGVKRDRTLQKKVAERTGSNPAPAAQGRDGSPILTPAGRLDRGVEWARCLPAAPKGAGSKEDLEPAAAVPVRHGGQTWSARIDSSHEANFARERANSRGHAVREPDLRKAASPFNLPVAVRQDTQVWIEETDSILGADSNG